MDTLRPYTLMDRDACLRIFDSNVPRYFDPLERDKFARFLLEPVGSYFVVERHARVLACGGYLVLSPPSVAELTWGMVDCAHQGSGLGKYLTVARLDAMKTIPEVSQAYINTSQRVQGFYEGLGFSLTGVKRDGHGKGLDSVEMHLKL
ncbi:GNAT family N-acetyltransferase [Pseudomonas asturiensis]|uniref:GNAT family N-acetyltransferase n=1 Tax=Pseudomonas asturiensis TaxID=1190415 RepID=A0ABX6HH85_9PSED|nr:GNAT family N-acetyltransferase [Pseudomonas asturiensis]QHF04761.1 GNAT family N-acetyltransferase [Pseudomonas asturiensis]